VALAPGGALAIFQRWEMLATVGPVALLFAPLLWLAARCRPVFAAAAAFIVNLSIVLDDHLWHRFFGNPDLPIAERVLAAQLSILLVTLGALNSGRAVCRNPGQAEARRICAASQ